MEDVPLHVRMNIWMQHYGAPPYYALCSRQVMSEIFDEKWIGLDRWSFVKERVIAVAPTMPNDMKERICRACTEII